MGKKLFLILIIILIVFVFYFIYFNPSEKKFILKEMVITGYSMEPLLKEGDRVSLMENYYLNHSVKKGDLVAYEYMGSEIPVIKVVLVTDKDIVEIIEDKLIVNYEFLKNSENEGYIFSDSELKMLNLYINGGHLPKDSFFIFGDNIHSSRDSRDFGAVSKNDFLGKLIKTNQS